MVSWCQNFCWHHVHQMHRVSLCISVMQMNVPCGSF